MSIQANRVITGDKLIEMIKPHAQSFIGTDTDIKDIEINLTVYTASVRVVGKSSTYMLSSREKRALELDLIKFIELPKMTQTLTIKAVVGELVQCTAEFYPVAKETLI